MTADNLTALPDACAWQYRILFPSGLVGEWSQAASAEKLDKITADIRRVENYGAEGRALYTEQQVRALLAARDAERGREALRYRWLRNGGIRQLPYDDRGLGPEYPDGSDLDAVIDAYIAAFQPAFGLDRE